MVFSSSIFLFWFLPISLLLVFILPKKYKNAGLLALSLLFYSWGEPKYILVMLFSIGLNYFLGLKIERSINKKVYLTIAIIGNLSILGFFKYWGFLVENVNLLADQPVFYIGDIYLPIGISFFTFQAISYVVDVYRKETQAQTSLIDLALYISLFPQLIAGPIVRYHDINKQLKKRTISWSKFTIGVERFSIGLIKKVLIANNFAYIADHIFDLSPSQLDTPLAWLGILAYTFQIYFDFSGYSDMAIGLAKMFGFDLLENFNYPYISKSIKEFWRRWHISLSSWFRDYLYIPLGGNRVNKSRMYINLIIVFLLTGLWHGASWNFVIWGIFHGSFLILERVISPLQIKIPNIVKHIYTLLAVVVGWVFFRAETLPESLNYINTMFAITTNVDFPNNVRFLVSKELMYVGIMAIIFSMPTRRYLLRTIDNMSNYKWRQSVQAIYYLMLFGLLVISLSYIAADTYNPFIYFRF